jgi:hypothetical protein
MDPSKDVETIKEAIRRAVEAMLEGNNDFQLDLGSLNLNLNIKGSNWGGIVDKPVAKFLVDFDNRIQTETRKLGYELPRNTHGVVALEIKEGSWEALLKFSKEFIKIQNQMTPQARIILFSAILVGIGVWRGPDFVNAINAPALEKVKGDAQTEAEKAKGEAQAKLLEGVAKVVASSRELQAPLRNHLIGSMTEEDTIRLPDTDERVNKKMAQASFGKTERSKPQTFYIDHVYTILSINMRKTPWEVTLNYADVTFNAKLDISTEDARKLWEDFQTAHSRRSVLAPNLQVTARVNQKCEIVGAHVIGIGDPRDSSRKLSDVLASGE